MFRAFYNGGPSVVLKDLPPREKFLDWRHYLRAKLASNMRDKVKSSVFVEDEKYQYWIDLFPLFTLVTGTDDSGKLFSFVTRLEPSTDCQRKFRRSIFRFELHWHELRPGQVDDVFVRLQGDLVVRLKKLDYERVLYNAESKDIVLVPLKAKDYKMAVMLDRFIARVTGVYPDVDLFREYLDRFLEEGVSYRVVWRRHRLEFRGLRLNDRAYVIANGKLKVTHPEHGVNELDLRQHVVVYI